VTRVKTYLHAKFHLDPSNRLATVHERHRQTGQTGQETTDRQTDRQTDNGLIAYGKPFYKRSPNKNDSWSFGIQEFHVGFKRYYLKPGFEKANIVSPVAAALSLVTVAV